MSCVSASALIVARLDAARGRVPLLARFSYDAEDPYVVQATFFDGPTALACWNFDRQMLAEGLHRPVGEGDVSFSPHTAAGADELRVALRGPSAEMPGNAVLFLEARAIASFLEQSYAVTGAGEEFLDLDRLLEEFRAS
ncbi:sporulation-specific cell division protein SsgB [Streptomyces nojiriensis]|uniref:Sporulation-specific cell division protein SsgB n=1 Tax=Streptomyces nojiriensis TaxID=66374 RepID=A0ABQ3SN78_9ACTN|nr:SsgA family sporulation/cell division regulator [Streptomyces nojiriensis]QTI43068.1 Sporulation-specific cell division protein SsgB [Streptomyces nojiriensis]GGS30720.1 sporulation-specific cell division protein SsgB [Streptomyces nojiriensis]GHI69502.1 sporulation-specific cell division protein SsgB [Streptomyces nojiriensis]